MKKNLILLLMLLSFISNGCSNKNNITNDNTVTTTIDDKEDSFDDEFSEFDEKENEINDPFESYNRTMTSFNDTVYINILNPIANTYANIVHKNIRIGISNVFDNLFYPIRLVNNLLQGKINNSYEETQRFLINSTIGIFGIFDVAKNTFNIKEHNEDFGQTLGYWGVKSGPHIVLPFLGPSNLRDTFSLPFNAYLDPTMETGHLSYKFIDSNTQSTLIYLSKNVNRTSLNIGMYESLKKDSLDFYTFMRDFYEAKRENEIKD